MDQIVTYHCKLEPFFMQFLLVKKPGHYQIQNKDFTPVLKKFIQHKIGLFVTEFSQSIAEYYIEDHYNISENIIKSIMEDVWQDVNS